MIERILHSVLHAPVPRARRGVIINEHALSAKATRAHVEAIARHCDLIGHDELPARIARRSGRPFCLLTFDDGRLSNLQDSAPVLNQMGVPAVFYVTTDFVGGRLPLWYDEHHLLLKTLGRMPAGLEEETLKQLPVAMRTARLRAAAERHGVSMEPLRSAELAPMTWEDVRTLDRMGHTIGAHGRTHAILTRESLVHAQGEIEESIRMVAAETGKPCVTFAFPNGNHNGVLRRHAQACGAATIMTTDPLWVNADSPLTRLPRVQLFESSSAGRIAAKLAMAAMSFGVPNPDGTGHLYRRVRRAERAAGQRSRHAQGGMR